MQEHNHKFKFPYDVHSLQKLDKRELLKSADNRTDKTECDIEGNDLLIKLTFSIDTKQLILS